MNKVKAILKNRFFRFGVVSVLLTILIIWIGNYWLFLCLIPVFDFYVTGIVKWKFWEKENPTRKQKKIYDWVEIIIVAMIIAIITKSLFFEAITIPSESMEKTLQDGDYILVNKITYGPRFPQTVLTLPFSHNKFPYTKTFPSYLKWIELPYKRLKGFSKVRHNDIIVFAFPEGDTIIRKHPNQNYYALVRKFGRTQVHNQFDFFVRPIDKHDYYVKRCVGLPNDTIEIKNGVLFVNGKPEASNGNYCYDYIIRLKYGTDSSFFKDHGIVRFAENELPNESLYKITLSPGMVDSIKNDERVRGIRQHVDIDAAKANKFIFPHSPEYMWTEDNFGPLLIPSKGDKVFINKNNYHLYKRIISVYEGNELKLQHDSIYINGTKTNIYKFKQDYFFVLGDNRHHSDDSRFWGFVPKDHIIGKASLIWLSIKKQRNRIHIRWNKTFKTIH